MESASTSTASFCKHSLPHQQFTSRIAFVGKSRKAHAFSTKKTVQLPPISRRHAVTKSAETIDVKSPYGSLDSNEEMFNHNNEENLRVKQLERNISFIKEHCQQMLKCLHNELEDLKIKNRDLQFQLITGGEHHSQRTTNEFTKTFGVKESLPQHITEYINKLEKEIKRLRYALNESLKTNGSLQNEMRKLRRKDTKDEIGINSLHSNNTLVMSPPIGDFFETLQTIYRETNKKTVYLPRITNNCD